MQPRRRGRGAPGRHLPRTHVVVDRNGAQGWAYLTGACPGENRPNPDGAVRLRGRRPPGRSELIQASSPMWSPLSTPMPRRSSAQRRQIASGSS